MILRKKGVTCSTEPQVWIVLGTLPAPGSLLSLCDASLTRTSVYNVCLSALRPVWLKIVKKSVLSTRHKLVSHRLYMQMSAALLLVMRLFHCHGAVIERNTQTHRDEVEAVNNSWMQWGKKHDEKVIAVRTQRTQQTLRSWSLTVLHEDDEGVQHALFCLPPHDFSPCFYGKQACDHLCATCVCALCFDEEAQPGISSETIPVYSDKGLTWALSHFHWHKNVDVRHNNFKAASGCNLERLKCDLESPEDTLSLTSPTESKRREAKPGEQDL